jgi:RNA polymerase sigma-70 factor (ECF subfamily)
MDRWPSDGDLARLLAATAAGDTRAFAQLYAQTAPRLYPLLLYMLHERDRADDALQEVLIRLWRHAHEYTPARGRPLAWIARIARNQARDDLTRRRPQMAPWEEASLPGMPDPAPTPDRLAGDLDDARSLHGCLKALELRQRACVYLAHACGLSHAELAVWLGAPPGTVKTWVRRGLAHLRECLSARVERPRLASPAAGSTRANAPRSPRR